MIYSFYFYHTIKYNIKYIQFIRYTWLEADSICVLFQFFLKENPQILKMLSFI